MRNRVRACGESFAWSGAGSFQTLVQQIGYRDQSIRRNVATVTADGGPQVISLQVRNPLTTTEPISLTHTLVGLPGWQVAMERSVTLGPGETTDVNVQLTPPETKSYPGDAGRVETWAHTPDGQSVGSAWLQVWQKTPAAIYLPLVLRQWP